MSYWLDLEKKKNIAKIQTVAFASAAHEFKNPLNAIVSSLEILEPLIDKRGVTYYTLAKCCSNLMLFLVKDILDYSQIESQSLILNKAPVQMHQLTDECMSALGFKAQEKGISLTLTASEANYLTIVTDANRVKQIIINLLSNAIKYT
jgi:two-component system, sensor histidine kinase